MIPFLAPVAGFLAPAGTAIGGFLKRIPDWVIWLIAAVVLLKFVDMRAEQRGRNQQKAKGEAETIKAVNRIEHESSTDADQADTARSSAPRYPDASGVPDAVAKRIFRPD